MNSFLVAARVVVPMALMMGVGVLMRLTKITDRETMKKVDRMIFKLFMPLLMFYNIYTTDFSVLNGAGYIFYGLAGLFILFLGAIFVVPKCMKRRDSAAAMGQALVRPNYILFGAAVAQSIYGPGNIGAVMLLGAVAVPAFNAMAAVILEMGRNGSAKISKLIKAILTNPTVIAALIGITMNLTGLRMPELVEGVVDDISGLTTPLSFLSLGVSLNITSLVGNKITLLTGVILRLIVIPAVFLMGAVALGIHGVQLCAMMVLFAAPTAVSSYPMAVAMDADGELAGQMVAFSTLFAIPTFFGWTALLSALCVL